ncbi:MAG: tetratricopeptide repeat protein, partial [Bdellovibrionales bacterium]|nr:tetratricopeptide repeat protein [Bdellovibrionales bacterium]
LAQSPNFKPAHIYLGRVYGHFAVQTEDGKILDEAITHFLKASLLDPADPESLFHMGRLYMDVKKYSAAEDQFEKVIKLNENYPLIHYYIGSANFLQGGKDNLERALKAGKIETQKNPNLAGAYILLGKIHKTKAEKETTPREKRVQFELCKQEYQKAVRLRPKDVSLYISLVSCYVGSGETDSALQIIKQFVKGEGTSGYAELYQLQGKIYEMKGDYQSAGVAYERYFGLNPGAPDRGQIENRLKPYYQFKKDP